MLIIHVKGNNMGNNGDSDRLLKFEIGPLSQLSQILGVNCARS